MKSRFRLLSIVVLALLLLALPGVGLAVDPHSGSDNAGPSSGTGSPLVLPAPISVPGASVLTLGVGDISAWSSATGASLVVAGGYYWYSTSTEVDASIRLPAGATIWQVNAYGYLTATGTQTWHLYDSNVLGGGTESILATLTSPSAIGVTQATTTFASGVTLAVGHHWYLNLNATSSTAGYVGAIIQYSLPTLSFVPITPVRLLDSRDGNGMPGGTPASLTAYTPVTFQITGRAGIPAKARAVTGNLTVTQQSADGYLFIGPVAMNAPTSSTLNFPVGDNRANAVTVALGAGGTLSITYVAGPAGATTHVVFDVTGYYQ